LVYVDTSVLVALIVPALHLACAEQAGARGMATLDAVLARQAQRLRLKAIAFA
jgi:hypothetical protein